MGGEPIVKLIKATDLTEEELAYCHLYKSKCKLTKYEDKVARILQEIGRIEDPDERRTLETKFQQESENLETTRVTIQKWETHIRKIEQQRAGPLTLRINDPERSRRLLNNSPGESALARHRLAHPYKDSPVLTRL